MFLGQGITPFKPFSGGYYNSQRYFSTLDGSNYFTIPTVTLSGDFEIEFDFSTTDNSVTKLILGQALDDDYIALLDTDRIQISINDVSYTINQVYNDGKLHSIKVTRVGTTVTTYFDGVSIDTQTDSNNFIIEEIGSYKSGTVTFSGVIANVKITDAGTLIRNYPIDEDWDGTTTLIDYGADGSNGTAVSITSANAEQFTLVGADYLGAELVVNGDFATDSDWTKGTGWTISGGKASSDGSQVTDPIIFQAQTDSTNVWQYKVVVSDYTAGVLEIRGATQLDVFPMSAVGTYTETQIRNDDYNFITLTANLNFIGSVDSFSVKRILQAP